MYSSRGSVKVEELATGYLKKQGPPNRPNWKKRWFVLTQAGSDRKLSYYKKKTDGEKVCSGEGFFISSSQILLTLNRAKNDISKEQ